MGGREGRERGVREGGECTIHSIIFGVFRVCWG